MFHSKLPVPPASWEMRSNSRARAGPTPEPSASRGRIDVLAEVLPELLGEVRSLVPGLALGGPPVFFLGTGHVMRKDGVRFCGTERFGTARGAGGFSRLGNLFLTSRFGDPMERLGN